MTLEGSRGLGIEHTSKVRDEGSHLEHFTIKKKTGISRGVSIRQLPLTEWQKLERTVI